MKKKEVNTKSVQTQGRRAKEKIDDDIASMKLETKPGPAFDAGRSMTLEQIMEARDAKAAKAAADPNGKLLDQTKEFSSYSLKHGNNAEMMKETLARVQKEYPATFNLLRYQWIKMSPVMRSKVLLQSPDYKAIYGDPEMAPFIQWLERLEGRGSPENSLRYLFRRTVMREKLALAEMWQETDAALAESRSEDAFVDVALGNTHPEEEASEYVGLNELPKYQKEGQKGRGVAEFEAGNEVGKLGEEARHKAGEFDDDEDDISILHYYGDPEVEAKIKAGDPSVFEEREGDPFDIEFNPSIAEEHFIESEEVHEMVDEIDANPDIQLALNYFAQPRASIDHEGKLQSALESNPVTDVEILTILNARNRLNEIMIGFKRNILADLPVEIQRDMRSLLALHQNPPTEPEALQRWKKLETDARQRLEDAEGYGFTKNPSFVAAVANFQREHQLEFVPDAVALRLLVDNAEKNVDDYMPQLKKLAEMEGIEFAEESSLALAAQMDSSSQTKIALQKIIAHDMEQNEALAGEIDENDEDQPEPAFLMDALEEVYLNMQTIEDEDGDELDEALMPEYSQFVTREIVETEGAPFSYTYPLTKTEKDELMADYQADLDSFLGFKQIDEARMSDADRAISESSKSSKAILTNIQFVLGLEDKTLRQQSREFLSEYLSQICERAGIIPLDEGVNVVLEKHAEDIRKALNSGEHKLSKKQAENLSGVLDIIDGLVDHTPTEAEELPIGNPNQIWDSSLEMLQAAKDAMIDYNAELNQAESHLDSIFAGARKITQLMLDPAVKPDYLKQLETMHEGVYGTPLPNPLKDVNAEDMLQQWTTQMREDIVMMESRTSRQRETDSIRRMFQKQMQPLETIPFRPELGDPDSGLYNFSSSDMEVERPLEERIYISSDLEVDEIFTQANVGKYLNISDRDIKRHLPEGFSLPLTRQEFPTTNTKSLLIRSQSLVAIANLKAQLNESFMVSKQAALATDNTSAKPMLLHGYRGCGKSAVLSQVVYWARRSGWFVVSVPDGADWLSNGVYISKNVAEGTWDQPKLFVRFFGHLLNAHADKLKQIPLKSQGLKIGKNVPVTLFDVVEYGSVLEQSASQCFSIFKSELRKIVEFPVLLAFDSYNSLYVPSRGFKDPESTSYYKDPINPYNLTLGRMFYDAHLNHKLAYGTFIGALSETTPVRPFAQYVPAKSKGLTVVSPKYLEVSPYTMQEFTTVMEHYKHKNWVRTDMRPGSASEMYIYQLTSGFADAVWSFSKRL
jgi:hypothetical protein